MSVFCNDTAQSCTYDCCDRNGTCPTKLKNCYYYYNATNAKQTVSDGAIAGIAVGSIVLLYILAIVIFVVVRRKKLLENIAAWKQRIGGGNDTQMGMMQQQMMGQPIINQQPNGYGVPQPYVNNGYAQPQPWIQMATK